MERRHSERLQLIGEEEVNVTTSSEEIKIHALCRSKKFRNFCLQVCHLRINLKPATAAVLK
jgi:hypothetical protein